jgi:hypothetical protein
MENEQKEIPYGYCHCGCGKKTNIISKNNIKQKLVKGQPFKYLQNHQHRKTICKRGHVIKTKKPCLECAKIVQKGYRKTYKRKVQRKDYFKEYDKACMNSINDRYIIKLHLSELPNYAISLSREIILAKRQLKELN